MQAEIDKAKSANAAPEKIAIMEDLLAEALQPYYAKANEEHQIKMQREIEETEAEKQRLRAETPAASAPAASQSVAATAPATTTPSPASDFRMNGTTITKYVGKGGNIVIPNGVTSIGDKAFRDVSFNMGNPNIISVTIPESVTSIGEMAFNDASNLQSVTINGNITSVGWWAFGDCYNITSVTIGKNGFISDFAENFWSIEKLTTINIDPANTSYSFQDGILYNKNKTVLILCLPAKGGAVTIPSTVTGIGQKAFAANKNITGVTIPNSVTKIETNAFLWCTSLTSITIGSGVTSIGNMAFWECVKLAAIKVDTANTAYSSQDGILYNKAKTQIIEAPKGITGNIIIPGSVTSIRGLGFRGCAITGVTIPASVTSIERMAFWDCSKLTSVTFEGAKTVIVETDSAFPGRESLPTAYSTGGAGTYTTTTPGNEKARWTKQ